MSKFIAYMMAKGPNGEDYVFSGIASTVGVSIREAAVKLNAAVASSGGFNAENTNDIRMVTAVFPLRDGLEKIRHEITEDQLRVFEVSVNESQEDVKGEPIGAVLVMNVNPLHAVDGQFIL